VPKTRQVFVVLLQVLSSQHNSTHLTNKWNLANKLSGLILLWGEFQFCEGEPNDRFYGEWLAFNHISELKHFQTPALPSATWNVSLFGVFNCQLLGVGVVRSCGLVFFRNGKMLQCWSLLYFFSIICSACPKSGKPVRFFCGDIYIRVGVFNVKANRMIHFSVSFGLQFHLWPWADSSIVTR